MPDLFPFVSHDLEAPVSKGVRTLVDVFIGDKKFSFDTLERQKDCGGASLK